MSRREYLQLIERLGYSPHQKNVGELFGRSHRVAQRYASGEAPIPELVARILRALDQAPPRSRVAKLLRPAWRPSMDR
jgi:hypothetical protein